MDRDELRQLIDFLARGYRASMALQDFARISPLEAGIIQQIDAKLQRAVEECSMSYCFDVMSRVFDQQIRPHLPSEEIALRFDLLIQAMHSANHRLGDGINKDPGVSQAARELEEAAHA